MAEHHRKGDRTSITFEPELLKWLWEERRRRDRSVNWLINSYVRKERNQVEKRLAKLAENADIED